MHDPLNKPGQLGPEPLRRQGRSFGQGLQFGPHDGLMDPGGEGALGEPAIGPGPPLPMRHRWNHFVWRIILTPCLNPRPFLLMPVTLQLRFSSGGSERWLHYGQP